MEGQRFDALTRGLTTAITRRRGLRAALLAIAGGAVATTGADAAVRRRTCRPVAAACLRNSDCCTGACETRRTAPRNQRNRCICVPDCEGKICGSDGCGGLCGPEGSYGCLSGETCSADGTACETGCSNIPNPPASLMCEASTEFETWTAYEAWDLVDEQPCDTAADCPTPGLCDVPGYECFCERAWRDEDGYQKYEEEQGACYYIRTVASACDAGPFPDSNPGNDCTETIEGEQFRHWGWFDGSWTGQDENCMSDQECIDMDSACTDTPSEKRCVCQIAGWENGEGRFSHGNGLCRMVYLVD